MILLPLNVKYDFKTIGRVMILIAFKMFIMYLCGNARNEFRIVTGNLFGVIWKIYELLIKISRYKDVTCESY